MFRHEDLVRMYKGEWDRTFVSEVLIESGCRMAERAEAVKNLDLLFLLAKGLERAMSNKEDWGAYVQAIHKYYESHIDELILISAFESYAKGKLIENEIVVHCLCDSTNGKKIPQKHPISFSDLQAIDNVTIEEKTIPVNLILKKKYWNHLDFVSDVREQFVRMNRMRNKTHFTTFGVFDNLDIPKLAAIKQFYDLVKQQRDEIVARRLSRNEEREAIES